MVVQLIYPELQELIQARNFTTLRETLIEWDPSELAELISEVEEEDQAIVFRLLPRELATETFEYLDLDAQQNLLKAMGQEQVAHILNEMSADDRTALLEELPAEVTKQLLMLLSPVERSVALTLLGYPESSVGRLMTPDYIAVQQEWTINEVLDYIRVNGKNSETLNMIYVVNEKNKLIDDIRIREFLLAPLDKKVTDIMDETFVSLLATDDQETAIEKFKKYDRVALPVTDTGGALIGIVTIDDVLDVAEEEVTEDIHKMGAVTALEYPYMNTPFLEMVKKRATWLVILFVGEMLTATAMSFFEVQIAKAVVLALFVPLIISSGGNSGSQASTLLTRALALGEISLSDWWNVMRREIFSGFSLGIILAIIGFIRIAAWQVLFNMYGPHWILVALTVSISLIGVVMWGTISGAMLPIFLKSLNIDPATSSAPFVATLSDVTGLIIYFSVAIFLMSGTML
jgi:magnesium transporter